MSTISIEVDDEVAQKFASATDEQRQKMQMLLNLQLKHYTADSGRSLKKTMDEISAYAKSRGLTPEKLESLLHDD